MIESNEANLAKMRDVAERLLGTCTNVDDVLQEVFGDDSLTLTDFPMELLHDLDDGAMQCESCGWWCEPGELDDDQTCGDCRE